VIYAPGIDPEDPFRLLVDAAPALLWRTALDGQHDYFNGTWLAFCGRTLEQDVGAGWTASIHADDLQRCLALHLTSFAQIQAFELEYRLRRHDGAHRRILERGVPFHVRGELRGFIGSCVDVTELREADEAKATFISMLTRELRKPLMPLLLCSQQIQLRALASDPEHVVVAKRIERQVERLRALVERVSRGSEIVQGLTQELRLGAVDLEGLVAAAIVEHRQRARARGANPEILSNGTWGKSRLVRADATEIAQVLDVLLDNALVFSPDDGTVTVELSFEPATVRIVIEDEGIGITQGELDRVGTAYFRAGNVASTMGSGGLGLGLTVARDIVGAHGGTLTLSSCAPQGTRATVVLPL
jgi:PAS domain S-box-containing protein